MFNEEKRLRTDSFRAFLLRQTDIGLLLVDDGSTDNTWALLQQIVDGADGRASLLRLPQNSGKAEAVRQGMRAALQDKAQLVGFWDADLATPLDTAADFVALLDSRPDFEWVFGARVKLLGRSIKRRELRHYLGRIFATAVSLSLRIPVYDTQCGAKPSALPRHLDTLLQEPFLTRWIFDVELLARFATMRQRRGSAPAESAIYEYPLMEWNDVAGSKVRARDFVRASVELLRIRLKHTLRS